MALKILYTKVEGTLTSDVSAATQLLPVDANTLSIINANLNFVAGDWTYLTLTNKIYSEEVKVISTQTNYLEVVRAQSGSTAQPFSAVNTQIYDHVGAQAIQDIIAANPSPANVVVQGNGISQVTSAVAGSTTTYTVGTQPPNFLGSDGISVQGVWPNLVFSYEGNDAGCCGGSSSGGSGTGGITTLTINSPILTCSIAGTMLTLGLTGPTFTGAGGITVTGSWAAGFTITGGGGGGTGTVQQVNVGTGLSLSGTPTVNPTLSLSNTGVAAGTYGDLTINAQGQITNITSGFAPVGNVVLTNGGNIVKVGSTYNITLNNAAVGVHGIVAMADSSGTFNPAEDTLATTSKVVAQAIAALSATIVGAGTHAGEAASAYTNTVAATATSLTLTTGQTALLVGEVCVTDTAAGTPAFGVAIITSGAVVLYSSRIAVAGKQCIVCLVQGPLSSATITISTTALAGTQAVTAATLAAIIV